MGTDFPARYLVTAYGSVKEVPGSIPGDGTSVYPFDTPQTAARSQRSPAPAPVTSTNSSAPTSHTARSKRGSTNASHDSAPAQKTNYPHPPPSHAIDGPLVRTSSPPFAAPSIYPNQGLLRPFQQIRTLPHIPLNIPRRRHLLIHLE
jgi:hypothetical protein